TAAACASSLNHHLRVERYVRPVRRRVSRKRWKICSRPSYTFATGTVPFTIQTACSAIHSHSARGSPPRNASKTRRIPSSAFKRCEREAVALELRVVELGELSVAGPDDRLAGRVDLVGERH